MGTDRPHVLRQAIHCCRNFGTVSIVGVYGGFLDKIPMGSAINRGLTFRMAQTPVQHYLPKLLERIEKGEIDPSFVITAPRAARGGPGTLQDVPRQEGRLHQGRDEAVTRMARVLIGTSGWHYDSWRGPFFPKGLPLKEQLPYYAGQFSTTELNGVFYRTPTPEAVRSWRDQTGRDFIFAWKASKFITHWKRLSGNSVNSLELLEDRLSLLGDKAGPILFQLPPNFKADADRLTSFFKLLPKKRRYSFEFRHPSWYAPRDTAAASRRKTSRYAYPIITMRRRPGSAPPTSSTSADTARAAATRVIIRADTLSEWARRIRSWKKQGCDVVRLFRQRPEKRGPCRRQILA